MWLWRGTDKKRTCGLSIFCAFGLQEYRQICESLTHSNYPSLFISTFLLIIPFWPKKYLYCIFFILTSKHARSKFLLDH